MLNNIGAALVAAVVCFSLAADAGDANTAGKAKAQRKSTREERIAAEKAADAVTSDHSSTAIELSGSGRHETIDCMGSTEVALNGASNRITLTGDCKSLTVIGNENKVTAEGLELITITGTGNTITWKHPVGKAKKPKVSATGTGNKVSKEQ